MPRFSVIVPVYNVEAYLEKCVSSILNQTFSNYEIILVDDGSTDKSGELCETLALASSDKIKVIHQENKGLGGARNTGLENAIGEYVLFIDSDDYIKETTLQEVNAFIDEKQVDMVMFDYCTVDEQGNIIDTVSVYDKPNCSFSLSEYPEMLFVTNCAWNKVYKRSIFEETKVLFPNREWFEDLSTVIKLYPFVKKIGYLNQCFYYYVQRSGSIMSNKNIDRNIEIISAIESLLSFYKENNLYEKYKEELEYLAVLHIYVLASVRVIKADYKSQLITDFKDYIKKNFPTYNQNKYVLKMSKKEKLIIKLLDTNNRFVLKTVLGLGDMLKK